MEEATRLQTVERAIALVEFVAASAREPTVKEASKALDLNVTTCYHLANTLQAAGYLVKNGRGLRLGPKVAVLHEAFLRRIQPAIDFAPVLKDLAGRTGETAYLATWDGGEVVLQAVVEGEHPVRVTGLYVGTRGDSHCRASGKAVFAYLDPEEIERYMETHILTARTPNTITDPDRIRAELSATGARGYAIDQQEFALGVCCLAAPYFGSQGRVLGAVTVSAPADRFGESEQTIRDAVLAAARQVSCLLGFTGAYPPDPPARVGEATFHTTQ